MNIIDKYINTSIWFNVTKITNYKRHNIDDPFTKSFEQHIYSNSILIDFDCTKIDKETLESLLSPFYNKIYLKLNNDTVLIFNTKIICIAYNKNNNTLTAEMLADDVFHIRGELL